MAMAPFGNPSQQSLWILVSGQDLFFGQMSSQRHISKRDEWTKTTTGLNPLITYAVCLRNVRLCTHFHRFRKYLST